MPIFSKIEPLGGKYKGLKILSPNSERERDFSRSQKKPLGCCYNIKRALF